MQKTKKNGKRKNSHLLLSGVGAQPNLLDEIVEPSRLVGTLNAPEGLRQDLFHTHTALSGAPASLRPMLSRAAGIAIDPREQTQETLPPR